MGFNTFMMLATMIVAIALIVVVVVQGQTSSSLGSMFGGSDISRPPRHRKDALQRHLPAGRPLPAHGPADGRVRSSLTQPGRSLLPTRCARRRSQPGAALGFFANLWLHNRQHSIRRSHAPTPSAAAHAARTAAEESS